MKLGRLWAWARARRVVSDDPQLRRVKAEEVEIKALQAQVPGYFWWLRERETEMADNLKTLRALAQDATSPRRNPKYLAMLEGSLASASKLIEQHHGALAFILSRLAHLHHFKVGGDEIAADAAEMAELVARLNGHIAEIGKVLTRLRAEANPD